MIKMPESMDECLYFTNRTIGEKGNITAWIFKPICPKCKKAKLGKPVDKKTGKIKIRAKEYTCPNCGYSVEKTELEPTLTLNIRYTCPFCGKSGDAATEYKLKSYKGVKAYIFKCQFCGEKIGITKKMKAPKKK